MSCDFEVGAYARMSLSYPPGLARSDPLANYDVIYSGRIGKKVIYTSLEHNRKLIFWSCGGFEKSRL